VVTELHAVWSDPTQAGFSFANDVRPWCRDQWAAGKRLAVHILELEDEKSDRQRRYYHGVVLTEIAEQARANGEKYPMPVWKEHFRKTFLGEKRKTFINPITGKKSRRLVRISTEDLGVRAYSNLIEQVTAFAATELGVQFSVQRWEEYR
jgi:hypothetical protein